MADRRFRAQVETMQPLGRAVWLTVSVPGWPGAAPGQFVLLQAEPSVCFLARPLSVAAEEGSRVSFLIAPVGTGTRELARLRAGDVLWVLGPLGKGFPLEEMLERGDVSRLVLVGGGVGVAPLPLLLRHVPEHLRARRAAQTGESQDGAASASSGAAVSPAEVLILLGFRDRLQAEAAEPVLEAASRASAAGVVCRSVLTTEDGSVGRAGLVTGVLAEELRPGDCVAVCGPWPMAEAVWSACAAVPAVRSWFSLETIMACGVGSCHGCVIASADGRLVRVCTDGPVFTGEQIWEGPGRRSAPAVRATEAED